MKIWCVYIMQACENFSVTHENKSNCKSQVTALNLCRNEPSPKESATSIFTSDPLNAHTRLAHKKPVKRSKVKTAMPPLYFFINPLFIYFFADPRHNEALTCS